jgi:CRISPR system Cascade subunit CasA
MTPFNLIDSPWIPIRYANGFNALVSLDTLFREAEQIADLDCPPHERISLMRLLICLSQAELGAPDTPEDWGDFGSDLGTRIPSYLRRSDIQPHFNLFGDGPRFLQVPIHSEPEPVSASKLVPHLATGNNSTLLDHEGADEKRSFSAQRLATALVSFQCFYPLYGAGYKGKGPCVDGNMLHTLVVGSNLKDSILSNCLTADYIEAYYPHSGMGCPIWELDCTKDGDLHKAIRSYLGRLVPRHRSLWLLEDRTGFLLQKEGLEYPRYEEAREPSATVVVITKKDQQERRLLPARLDKSVWRDLHMLTVLRQSSGEEARAPLVLHAQAMRLGAEVRIWTGAMVTDLKAKIYDTIESTFTLPTDMLTSENSRSLYQAGVDFAEKQSNQLYGAVRQYGSTLKNENPPTEEAKRCFWNTLELRVGTLLGLVRNPDPLTTNFGEDNDPWTLAVRGAALRAYEQVCPRQTPRQIQAYATGLKVLRPKSNKKPPKKVAAV